MAGANRRIRYNPGYQLPTVTPSYGYNGASGYGGGYAPPSISYNYGDDSLVGGVVPFDNILTSSNQVPNSFGMVGRSSMDKALTNPSNYPSSAPYSYPTAPYPTQPIGGEYGPGGGGNGQVYAGAFGIDLGFRDLNPTGVVQGNHASRTGYNVHGLDVVGSAMGGGLLGTTSYGLLSYPGSKPITTILDTYHTNRKKNYHNLCDNSLTQIPNPPPASSSPPTHNADTLLALVFSNSHTKFTTFSFAPTWSDTSSISSLTHLIPPKSLYKNSSQKHPSLQHPLTLPSHNLPVTKNVITLQAAGSIRSDAAILSHLGTDVSLPDLDNNAVRSSVTTTPPTSTGVLTSDRVNAPSNAEVLNSIDMVLAERFHNGNGDSAVFGKGFGSVLFEGKYVGGTSIYNTMPGGLLYQRQPVSYSTGVISTYPNEPTGYAQNSAAPYGSYNTPQMSILQPIVTANYIKPYVDQNANGVYSNLDIHQGSIKALPAPNQNSYQPTLSSPPPMYGSDYGTGTGPVSQRQQWGNGLGFQQFATISPHKPITTMANGLGVNIVGTRKPTNIGYQNPSFSTPSYTSSGYPTGGGGGSTVTGIGLQPGYGYDASIVTAPAYSNSYAPPAVGSGPIGYGPTMQGAYFDDYGFRQGYFFDDTFHASFAAPAAPTVSGGHYFFTGNRYNSGSGGYGYNSNPSASYTHSSIANPQAITDGSNNLINVGEYNDPMAPTVTIRVTGDIGLPNGSTSNIGNNNNQPVDVNSVTTPRQMVSNAQSIVNSQRINASVNGHGDISSVIITPASSSNNSPRNDKPAVHTVPIDRNGSNAQGTSLGSLLGSQQSTSLAGATSQVDSSKFEQLLQQAQQAHINPYLDDGGAGGKLAGLIKK